VSAEQ